MKNEIKNQTDLARACGVDQRRMNKIISGKANASVEISRLIDSHLGLEDNLLWNLPEYKDKRRPVFYKAVPRNTEQSEFARKCGVEPQQINQILSGKSNASIGLAKCIDSKLGLNDALLWIDPVRAGERKQAFYDAIGRV